MNLKPIKKAEKFARKTHKGQKQATGRPYFEHVKKTAEFLRKKGQDEEVIAAGYLHDVVEDSDVSLNEIRKIFGKRVAFLVDGMSWERDKKTRLKNWPKTYKKFSKYSIKDSSLVMIKVADMLSNIPNTHAKSNRKYVIEKGYFRVKSFWLPFIRETGFKKEAKKIESALNKYSKKRIKSVLYDYASKKELSKIRENLK